MNDPKHNPNPVADKESHQAIRAGKRSSLTAKLLTLETLAAWIDADLLRLEDEFSSFKTANSIRRNIGR